jgi:hypothetical protein
MKARLTYSLFVRYNKGGCNETAVLGVHARLLLFADKLGSGRDEPVVLRTEGIHLKYISSTTIVVGIDQDFEVVVQLLADVAAQFGCNDPGGLRVKTMNPKIDSTACVENPNFRFFSGGFSFVRLSLVKIRDPLWQSAKLIIVDARCFRRIRNRPTLGAAPVREIFSHARSCATK